MRKIKKGYGLAALAAGILFYSSPIALSAMVCTVGTNCITNPGFESGFTVSPIPANTTQNGWTTDTYAPSPGDNDAKYAIVADGNNSGHAANIVITNWKAGDGKWVAADAATVSPGQLYTISFWYKSSTSSSAFILYNGKTLQWFKNLPPASAYTKVSAQILIPDKLTTPAGQATPSSAQPLVALASVGSITVDDFDMELQPSIPSLANGLVTFTFDDGWQSFNDVAVPILGKHNFKATEYIITGPRGSNLEASNGRPNVGYMGSTTLRALQNQGFEIAAHTRDHLDLVKQTLPFTGPDGIKYNTLQDMWNGEIVGSKNDLAAHGISPVSNFAYPFGSYNSDVENFVKNAGFLSARSADQGENIPASDKYALKALAVSDQVTAASVNAAIDQALSDKAWLILLFHNVRTGNQTTGAQNPDCINAGTHARDTDCTTSAVLQDIADHVANVAPNWVKTMEQGMAAMLNNGEVDHTITATAGANGSITPSGAVSVADGASQAFAIKPDSSFVIDAVLIDGVATTSTSSIKLANIKADHTISVTFKADKSDHVAPIIKLNGDAYVSTPVGVRYTDAGATTTPAVPVTVTGTVATSTVGTYTLRYDAVDSAGDHAVPVFRTVAVTELGGVSNEASANTTTSGFTVTWTTAASGTSRVVYDAVSHNPLTATSTNYGYANSTSEDTASTTSHSVTVTGLAPNTTYYLRGISHGSPDVVGPEISVTTTAAPVSSGGGNVSGGGGGGSGNGPIAGSIGGGGGVVGFYYNFGGGSVLGVSTTTVPSASTQIASGFRFLTNLSKGMRNSDVFELQKRLIAEGFLMVDAPSNYFGMLTFKAVKAYQSAHNLPPVGKVGPRTRAVLNGDMSVTNGASTSNNTSLIAVLQAKLKELMDKIAALTASGTTSTSSTSTTTSLTSATSTATSTRH